MHSKKSENPAPKRIAFCDLFALFLTDPKIRILYLLRKIAAENGLLTAHTF
jgi:hypothetical protein